MHVCRNCGHPLNDPVYDSRTRLFSEDGNTNSSGSSWLCFKNLCSTPKVGDSEVVEISSEEVLQYGNYIRKKTLHFDLDPHMSNTVSNLDGKKKQSILKAGGAKQVRRDFLFYFIILKYC